MNSVGLFVSYVSNVTRSVYLVKPKGLLLFNFNFFYLVVVQSVTHVAGVKPENRIVKILLTSEYLRDYTKSPFVLVEVLFATPHN